MFNLRKDSKYKYLPYTDIKDVGAADFYFAINATFRFIHDKFGIDVLREYWRDLADQYYAPVSRLWQEQGMSSVKNYWEEFFQAEPGGAVDVSSDEDSVTVSVKVCPAVSHLKKHKRSIVPYFCEQCYYLGKRVSENAGYDMDLSGGNGSCCQKFYKVKKSFV
ncbi:MAG: hypothetical protein ACYTFY_07950 [Planctomycetota bacterium]|jgi:hypothetical protein